MERTDHQIDSVHHGARRRCQTLEVTRLRDRSGARGVGTEGGRLGSRHIYLGVRSRGLRVYSGRSSKLLFTESNRRKPKINTNLK